jgi:hypothetical protein
MTNNRQFSLKQAPLRALIALATISLGSLTFACGGASNYSKSVYGTEGGYSMKNVRATPPSLLVAKKVELPLYLVLDATRVKDTWKLQTSACATASPGCEQFNVLDMHEFVKRDLRAAMQNYFSKVEIVSSSASIPKGAAHVVGDVKIDDLKLHALVRGMFTHQIIEMTWSFAMRRSQDADYIYSFAGTSTSNDSYPTFEAGCGQLVENAIPMMLKKWTESGGIEAMRK